MKIKMNIKEKRATNELHIKITWVLELDSSETEFQLRTYVYVHTYICSHKK